MAHSLSAKKRIRQNAKRRARNRGRKRALKVDVREFEAALAGGDKAKAAEALKAAVKSISKTAAKGTLHKNAASRRISRLQKKYNALAAKA
ncbi:MAG TPA: 30S ribosomal protein S20 [Phycisphaerae bacterium]|nr:30S ribosomal protein S20 [Phycisphaerae bacterium]HRR86300.1 30S ribosomal protein S20 [Phycisphaerae bacterium]